MQTNSSQAVSAASFVQFIQRRPLYVLLAVVIGAVLAFFTFQFLLSTFLSDFKDPFPLLEGDIVRTMRIVNTDPLIYYAVVQSKDGNEYMMLNGRKEALYKEIRLITTSEVGDISYTAQTEEGWVVVRNRKESKPYEAITETAFSSNGERLAYIVGEECQDKEDEDSCSTYHVILDGNKQTSFEEVQQLLFSPDSQHVAYVGINDIQAFVILDGEEGNVYASVRDLRFLPDSSDVAFFVPNFNVQHHYASILLSKEEPREILSLELAFDEDEDIEDEEESLEDDEDVIDRTDFVSDNATANYFVHSPDGKHTAFAVQQEAGSFVVVDGAEGKHYTGIISELLFSPDSQHVAYILEDEEQSFVVVNDEEGDSFPDVVEIIFSANSQRLGYRVIDETGKHSIVLDDKRGEDYEFARNLVFSPNSEYLIYRVRECENSNIQENCQEFIVLDGEQLEEFSKISVPRFSIDSSSLFYLAEKIGQVQLIQYYIQ